MKTSFDAYLEEHLKDPAFAERFEKAGEAWGVALQMREKGHRFHFNLANRESHCRILKDD